MYLQQVIYQMQTRIESLLPCFHRSERRNLALMTVGMVYSKSVCLPQIAASVVSETQTEALVQRFERLLKCPKLIPLEALKPVAREVLRALSAGRKGPLLILMDRSMIRDELNLLWISVEYEGRALPLGWVEVPHEGNSDLALQQQILSWLQEVLPVTAEAVIVADREFHSIHLAQWIAEELQMGYVLRIRAGTYLELDGRSLKAAELAVAGESLAVSKVKITKDKKVDYLGNLTVHWEAGQEEPWVLGTNLGLEESISIYRRRFRIEEMFSDHKSRGLNLEQTRLRDPERVQRLLVALTLAYLWIMEIGALTVKEGKTKQVDNKGADRSVSLCQIGLRWLRRLWNMEVLPPIFSLKFEVLEKT